MIDFYVYIIAEGSHKILTTWLILSIIRRLLYPWGRKVQKKKLLRVIFLLASSPFKLITIEGKQYILKFPNGVETTYMFKNGLIYVHLIDVNGQKSYYELDFNGNVKNTKFPYELSEYKIVISDDQIVHENVIQLSNDYYREVIKLKWDKQADVIYNLKRELQQMDLQGGWEVKHLERIMIPKI